MSKMPELPPVPRVSISGHFAGQADVIYQEWADAYGRACLEAAAAEAEHWQTISTTPGHACGQYIAAAIRAMKDK